MSNIFPATAIFTTEQTVALSVVSGALGLTSSGEHTSIRTAEQYAIPTGHSHPA